MAPLTSINVAVGVVGYGIAGNALKTAALLLHLPEHEVPIEFTTLCLSHLGIRTPAHQLIHDDQAPWVGETLADPLFDKPGTVELLLGGDIVPRLLKPGLVHHDALVAQNTSLGRMIWGRQGVNHQRASPHCYLASLDESFPAWHHQLNAMLQRFWELEDVPPTYRERPSDSWCEKIFSEHRRDSSGRYIVRLPLQPDAADKLGSSENVAKASLACLHRRMDANEQFASEYRAFMKV
uniref:Pyridoxal kinase n=1 Tax=Trichogramma kaykai TaxID=54128 RepID=A0ABD2W124_9HYME